jgi:hypothetical protein
MVFKSYSIQTLIESASFTQDLKLGHYIKVPPRATFIGEYLHPGTSVSDIQLCMLSANCGHDYVHLRFGRSETLDVQ